MYQLSRKRNFCVYCRVCAALILCLAICSFPDFAVAKKKPPDHPIDLNVANIKELEELPGVGQTTAQAILDFREKSGRFRRVEDLLVIRGISQAKLEKMRPYLTVGVTPKPATPAAAPAANKATGSKPASAATKSP
jgi:competence ComEA-like helix-hairpin-helix protein